MCENATSPGGELEKLILNHIKSLKKPQTGKGCWGKSLGEFLGDWQPAEAADTGN
jgi:hypothetical protein